MEKLEEKKSIGSRIYTHLMSGVTHMLPLVIGGGIMMAIAFLIDTICGYGSSGGANFGTMTPLSSFFKYAGSLTMGLMVPVLAAYIGHSIAQVNGMAVGFAGGLLANNGNASIADYIWSNEQFSGFQAFLERFGFVGENSGNTVSGFLGGIAAGFLAGGIILLLQKLLGKLPQVLDGVKNTLMLPLLGVFIISVLMIFIFNPLIGLVNTGLSVGLTALSDMHLLVVLGMLLGGMMAIDMGGPINKAAYVFASGMVSTGTTYLEQGMSMDDSKVVACYVAMAAVMVGGMVPPVGIAIATFLFPKKFTKEERNSGISNLVMGSSFITEGAIPFAASDPIHVIPSTFIGAAVAGGMTALFKCTMMAPHGGIFVFATAGHPFYYVLSWITGSVVTALLLGILKKKKEEN